MKQKISINLASNKFQNDLIKLIQDSQLPIANVYFILQLVNDQLHEQYQSILQNEMQELQKPQEQNDTKDQNQE